MKARQTDRHAVGRTTRRGVARSVDNIRHQRSLIAVRRRSTSHGSLQGLLRGLPHVGKHRQRINHDSINTLVSALHPGRSWFQRHATCSTPRLNSCTPRQNADNRRASVQWRAQNISLVIFTDHERSYAPQLRKYTTILHQWDGSCVQNCRKYLHRQHVSIWSV